MTALARLATLFRRAPMFRDRSNAIATALLGIAIAYAGFRFVEWGIVNAIWSLPQEAGSEACRATRGQGACWAVIAERFRFIVCGAYPFDQQWRPACACLSVRIVLATYSTRPFCSWRP